MVEVEMDRAVVRVTVVLVATGKRDTYRMLVCVSKKRNRPAIADRLLPESPNEYRPDPT